MIYTIAIIAHVFLYDNNVYSLASSKLTSKPSELPT